jgi:hypothetical protein
VFPVLPVILLTPLNQRTGWARIEEGRVIATREHKERRDGGKDFPLRSVRSFLSAIAPATADAADISGWLYPCLSGLIRGSKTFFNIAGTPVECLTWARFCGSINGD